MITLSPSSIGQFDNCPACFWWEKKKGIPKPRGIYPSLPGGVDKLIKSWYDSFRTSGKLPPELAGKIEGVLYPDQGQVNVWRAWGMGLYARFEKANLSGNIDDAILSPKNEITILDGKTRGYPPKTGDSERYYGAQVDAYGLLFQQNGHQVSGKGHLAYYWPTPNGIADALLPPSINMLFETAVVNLEVRPERTLDLIRRIVEAVEKNEPPKSASDCEHCSYVQGRKMVLV